MNEIKQTFTDKVTVTSLNIHLEGKFQSRNTKFTRPFLSIGDEISIEWIPKKRGWKEKITQIEPLGEREKPFCQVYGECGGCVGQHIPYETQLKLKTRPILEYFGDKVQIYPAQVFRNYRNRMDFVVDGMKVGLRKKGNFREIVDIPNCPIQSKSSNEILELFRSVLKRFSTIPVLRRENQGILKYITIRSAPEFEKRILILTFISKEECLLHPELNEFKKIISETFSECNILACFGPRESEVSGTGDEDEIWNGEPELKFQFLNQSFESHYSGFVQPNLFEFTKVVLKLKELVPNSMERLYDVYCGMGFFSQIFKDRWRYAVGLESHPGAIERAKANFDPKSSEWHSMDLSLKKTKIPFQEEGFLILDPPRSGLGKQVLDWILANPWKEGVYVSCNPKTQILDWKVLSEFYEVVSFHVFDPYPFTPHLETILQFRRKSAFADT